ncbi:hypothetical protein N7488_008391 [Penicillium malachiteum]|nr:hypothetical protein N7488_008391 [Penicillium malachiteum]
MTTYTTLDVTAQATASVTEDVTADVTTTETTDLTTTQTNTETVDISTSQTVTQTADATATETTSVTATETSTTTVDVTEVATITSTSSFTVTATVPVTVQTTIANTVDVTSTSFTTSTIDVTVTETVSTTTTTTVTSTATSSPTCGVNIVSNSDFADETLSPWVFSYTDNGQMTWVSGDDTTYAIELYSSSSGASTAIIKQTIPTVSGETYTFTMDYNPISGSVASVLRCSVNNVYTTSYTLSLGSSRDIWRTYTGSFLASSSSTTLTCEISTSVIASVYIDNISATLPCSS